MKTSKVWTRNKLCLRVFILFQLHFAFYWTHGHEHVDTWKWTNSERLLGRGSKMLFDADRYVLCRCWYCCYLICHRCFHFLRTPNSPPPQLQNELVNWILSSPAVRWLSPVMDIFHIAQVANFRGFGCILTAVLRR